jgi:U6 snRNA-associated Sm-like protein LSm7
VPRAGEERPKKEAILDLAKYQDHNVRVKFTGGREIIGVLKGYDQLMNLVVDEVKETLRDPDDENVLLDETRDLGMVVVRGPLLQSISPLEGNEVIENPFLQRE